MTYKTIYIQPDSCLARARAQASSRDITVLASQKLVEGTLDECIADVVQTFNATGWPRRDVVGNKRLAVWVRPACFIHLKKLSQTYNVSILKMVTAWTEAAAQHQLNAQSTQNAAGSHPQLKPPIHVDALAGQPPAMADTPVQAQVIKVATTRVFQGRQQHLYACPRHRMMTGDQLSEVFQHGGLWLDHVIHGKVIANNWTLEQLLDALVQNPEMNSNVIAIPTPARSAATAMPAAPDYAGDFLQAAMAMFDPELKAA